MTPYRLEIEALAHQAGEILRAGYNPRPGFGPELQVHHKGVIDLVTEFDRRSEAFLMGEIRRRYPEHQMLGEESGIQGVQSGSLWVIDPLDGTVNYAHGIPCFAVSIAYQEDGITRCGVVYDPLRDECFSAERGQGAWLNGEPIRVSETSQLDDCLLATGFPYNIRTIERNNLDDFAHLTLLSQGVRRFGSAALDACYVAAGRLDGYWEFGLSPWDVAAGGLIAAEAGARVTNLEGGPDYLSAPQSVLLATPAIHAQMLALLNQ